MTDNTLAPETPVDDAFSKVFDQLISQGEDDQEKFPAEPAPAAEAPAPAPAAAPAEPEAPAEGAQPDAGAGDNGDVGGDAAPQAAEGEPKVGDKPEEPAPEDEKNVLKRFADLMEREQQERDQYRQAQQAQQAQPQVDQPQLFSSEEVEQLQSFEKDWPDVAQAMKVVMRANQQAMADYIFKEINKYLQPRMEMLDAVAQRAHYAEITSAIPNYEDTRDKVIQWALDERQPEYLRKAYEGVIKRGNVDEIRHLVEQYQTATGASVTHQQQPASAPAPSRKSPELPPAAKKAAQSLAPVSAQRSAPQVQDDPHDFTSAFHKFLKDENL